MGYTFPRNCTVESSECEMCNHFQCPNSTLTKFCNLGTEIGYTFHPQKIPPYNAFGMCNPFYIGPILPSGILPYEIGWDRGPAEDVSPDGDFDDENSVYFKLGPVDYSNYLDLPMDIRNHNMRH